MSYRNTNTTRHVAVAAFCGTATAARIDETSRLCRDGLPETSSRRGGIDAPASINAGCGTACAAPKMHFVNHLKDKFYCRSAEFLDIKRGTNPMPQVHPIYAIFTSALSVLGVVLLITTIDVPTGLKTAAGGGFEPIKHLFLPLGKALISLGVFGIESVWLPRSTFCFFKRCRAKKHCVHF